MLLIKKLLIGAIVTFGATGTWAQKPTITNATLDHHTTHHYSYSPNKQIIKDSTVEDGRAFAFVTTFEYNSNGQRTKESRSSGRTIFTYNSHDSLESRLVLGSRLTTEHDLDTFFYYKYHYTDSRLSSKEAKVTPLYFACLDSDKPDLELESYNYQYSNGRLTTVFITKYASQTLERHDYNYSKGKIAKVVKQKKIGDKNWRRFETVRYDKKDFDYLVQNERGKPIRYSKTTIVDGVKTSSIMWSENSFDRVFYNESGQRTRTVRTDFSMGEISFHEWISMYDAYGNLIEHLSYGSKGTPASHKKFRKLVRCSK